MPWEAAVSWRTAARHRELGVVTTRPACVTALCDSIFSAMLFRIAGLAISGAVVCVDVLPVWTNL